MSILDDAKVFADKARQQKEEEIAREATIAAQRIATLDEMKAAVLTELKLLDGEVCNYYGKFRFDQCKWSLDAPVEIGSSFAFLYAASPLSTHRVAWFKAGIISGTHDTDEVRGIPFIEPRVWARFYGPNLPHRRDGIEFHDGSWDLEEKRQYHNGGCTESARSMPSLQEFFKKMAAQLSLWM